MHYTDQKLTVYIVMLQKISFSNKYCYSELSIHQRILNEMYHSVHKILSCTTVFNTDNNNSINLTIRNVYLQRILIPRRRRTDHFDHASISHALGPL